MQSFIRQSAAQIVAGPKSLKRVAKTLAMSALSISLLGASIGTNPALALPEEQVSQKLSRVPVYVLGNNEGLVSIQTNEGESTQPNLPVFISEQDARAFLNREKTNNPSLASDTDVGIISLETLYQRTLASEERTFKVAYVPDPKEVSQAVEINNAYPGGVPLFYAQFEDGTLLPVTPDGGEAVYPLFFSRADLETELSYLAEQNPEARAAVSVGVIQLENVLIAMHTEDNDFLSRIQLRPNYAAMDAIRQNAPSAQ